MKASKIELRGEKRIMIEFPYNQEIASLIKQIPGSTWSRSLQAWHIPYGTKEFGQLKRLFPGLEYPNKVTEVITDKNVARHITKAINNDENQNKNVSVQVICRSIILKLPKNALDIHFIRSLRFSRRHTKGYLKSS